MLRLTFRMTVAGLIMALGLLVIPAPASAQSTSSNSGASNAGSGPATNNPAPGGARPASGATNSLPAGTGRPASGATNPAPAGQKTPAAAAGAINPARGFEFSAPNPLSVSPYVLPGGVPAAGAEKEPSTASLRTGKAAPNSVAPVPPGHTFRAGRLATLLKSDGKLAWPLVLTILPPAMETDSLRAQMDRIADMLVSEGASGRPDPGLVSELAEDVNKLQTLMRDRGDFLPVSDDALRDANGFLAKLRQAVQDLR